MSRNVRRYHRIFIEANGPGPWPCYGCGDPVVDLFVHHLDEDETNDLTENLVAMHRPCHVKLHHGAKPKTKEHRRKIGEANRVALTGKRLTADHRENIRRASGGWKHTPEARAKISAARIAAEQMRKSPK